MALSDVDISPGFVTQLSVTPSLTVTTKEAKNRFTPDERMCYFDEEFRFKYLPRELYRYETKRPMGHLRLYKNLITLVQNLKD